MMIMSILCWFSKRLYWTKGYLYIGHTYALEFNYVYSTYKWEHMHLLSLVLEGMEESVLCR